MARTSYVLMI